MPVLGACGSVDSGDARRFRPPTPLLLGDVVVPTSQTELGWPDCTLGLQAERVWRRVESHHQGKLVIRHEPQVCQTTELPTQNTRGSP